MLYFDIREKLAYFFDNAQKVFLRKGMIDAVEPEHMIRFGIFERVFPQSAHTVFNAAAFERHAVDDLGEILFVFGQRGGKAVAVFGIEHIYTAAVGGDPFKNAFRALGVASPRHSARDAEAVIDLRHLRSVTEFVYFIGKTHRAAEGIRFFDARLQIADQCFAAHDILQGLRVPRSYEKLTVFHELFELFLFFGTRRKIILHERELTVGHKTVAGLCFQNVCKAVEKLHEPHKIFFVGLIPFSVPMGVA